MRAMTSCIVSYDNRATISSSSSNGIVVQAMIENKMADDDDNDYLLLHHLVAYMYQNQGKLFPTLKVACILIITRTDFIRRMDRRKSMAAMLFIMFPSNRLTTL